MIQIILLILTLVLQLVIVRIMHKHFKTHEMLQSQLDFLQKQINSLTSHRREIRE